MSYGPHPKQPNEFLLDLEHVEVGDVIVGREVDDWQVSSGFLGWERVANDLFRNVAHPSMTTPGDSFVGSGRFRVVVKPDRRAARPPAAKADGLWNGTCHACGRGTYTGFNKVEHEGGGCR